MASFGAVLQSVGLITKGYPSQPGPTQPVVGLIAAIDALGFAITADAPSLASGAQLIGAVTSVAPSPLTPGDAVVSVTNGGASLLQWDGDLIVPEPGEPVFLSLLSPGEFCSFASLGGNPGILVGTLIAPMTGAVAHDKGAVLLAIQPDTPSAGGGSLYPPDLQFAGAIQTFNGFLPGIFGPDGAYGLFPVIPTVTTPPGILFLSIPYIKQITGNDDAAYTVVGVDQPSGYFIGGASSPDLNIILHMLDGTRTPQVLNIQVVWSFIRLA
jgi:hypothetical protein